MKKIFVNYNLLPKEFRLNIKITRELLIKGVIALIIHLQGVLFYGIVMNIGSWNN